MDTLTFILYNLAFILGILNLNDELRRDLMMLQQNSYRNERFARWMNESSDNFTWWRICGAVIFVVCVFKGSPHLAAMALVLLFSAAHWIKLRRAKYKKPLVMTKRALRINITSYVLAAIVILGSSLIWHSGYYSGIYSAATATLACYCCSHLFLFAANILLAPVEKSINKKYYNDAASRLASMPDLKIIGITGSYGKTTTKHYLHRILSEQFETLMTPGSYNTTLGVIRTVREMLKPYHEVFIVEMGAKQPGDIKEICDLVHPGSCIITAVGPQHLESFKTIENVQATKFELADALPPAGVAVINNDFEMIANRPVGNSRAIRYAVKNTAGADYVAENIVYSPLGTEFDAVSTFDGHRIHLSTRLVGECNISNLLAAVAIARHMGVADEKIRYAVEKIEQVEHRLSIKRTPGGITIIDDAFNSNPVGSAMALDVLAAMTPGKRILITPGMIELGDKQYDLNFKFGEKAATSCDVAIVVGHYNRDAIVNGLRKGGMDEKAIRPADSFAEAQTILASIAAAGDTVLYENDLPDTFK